MLAYSSKHPDRFAQAGQCWDGRSWSGTGSWEASWGSLREGIARDGRFHLEIVRFGLAELDRDQDLRKGTAQGRGLRRRNIASSLHEEPR